MDIDWLNGNSHLSIFSTNISKRRKYFQIDGPSISWGNATKEEVVAASTQWCVRYRSRAITLSAERQRFMFHEKPRDGDVFYGAVALLVGGLATIADRPGTATASARLGPAPAMTAIARVFARVFPASSIQAYVLKQVALFVGAVLFVSLCYDGRVKAKP